MSNVPVSLKALSLTLMDDSGKMYRLNIHAPSSGISLSLQEIEEAVVDLTADPVTATNGDITMVATAENPFPLDSDSSSKTSDDDEDEDQSAFGSEPESPSEEEAVLLKKEPVAKVPVAPATRRSNRVRRASRRVVAERSDSDDEDFLGAAGFSQEIF